MAMRVPITMFCGLAITFTTLAQQVTAANITLVASDATHSPFDSFAYPRLTSHSDSSPLVAVKPSVVTTNPQQTGVAIGSGDPLHWAVKTGGFTPAPFARGYFDSIGDYDTGGSGVVAFVGSAGDTRALGCRGSSRLSKAGFLPRTGGVPVAPSHPVVFKSPPQAGLFLVNPGQNTTLDTVLITGKTELPPSQLAAGIVSDPSVGSAGDVAFLSCAAANVNTSGIFMRGAAPGSPIRRIVDHSMSVWADGQGPKFHDFFGVSLGSAQAAFTANAWCGDKYECGIFVARDTGGDSWNVTRIAGACKQSGKRKFTGFGDAIISGNTVAFVAMTDDGAEGMYRADTTEAVPKPVLVAKAGDPVPILNQFLGDFAAFPQPPSVRNGELVFRAYTSSGDTGIFHASKQGKVRKLVSTMDLLEGDRTVVYMGSAESAFGALGEYVFYASTVNSTGKDGRDGIYLGYR